MGPKITGLFLFLLWMFLYYLTANMYLLTKKGGGLKILVSENPEIQVAQDHQPGLVLSGVDDTTLNSTQASTQQQEPG